MFKFFIKGLIRDRQRSLLPVIVVAIGVALAVLIQAWVTGIIGDMIDFNSKFSTGHVKIMSQAYHDNLDANPNDLALLNANEFLTELKEKYPEMIWDERINCGGLMDAPDENGETKEQGPAMGMGLDLLSEGSREIERLSLESILQRGRLPSQSGEILLSEVFSERLDVDPGDQVTLITSTMYGSMSITNFTVTGTIRFGAPVLDNGGFLADISDVRLALDMQDASAEILGYFPGGVYPDEEALKLTESFNAAYNVEEDDYSPMMSPLRNQGILSMYLGMVEYMVGAVIGIFLVAMSIVLWNAGLLGGLRRYGEMGLRMAIGEHKGHIYRSLLSESLFIGIAGSTLGTIIGLFFAKLLEKGIDFSSMLEGSTMMMTGIYKAQITTECYYIGFIPGLTATLLGTALAGIGIYRRQTASLFKELQA